MQLRHSSAIALTVTCLTAGSVVAGTAAHAGPSAPRADPVAEAAPPSPSVQSVRVPAVAAATTMRSVPGPGSRRVVAQLGATARREFGLVGLTWERGFDASGATAEVRVRTGGSWSAWQRLDVDETGTDAGAKPGTEPLWVGSADAVAARVLSDDGRQPSDLRVSTVDPGPVPAAASTAAATARVASARAESAPTYTARPSVVTRAQWGAPPAGSCDSPRVGSHLAGIVVHHTAGSNSYTAAEGPAVVRAIDAYHVRIRGWCDIGYNTLVDRYGVIYEGRAGGTNVPIRAAHSGNWDVNLYTSGVSMIGNFDLVEPTAAMKSAMVTLVGWRLGTNYLPATGTITIAGRTLNIIAGHRDVYNAGIRPATSTTCPGRYGYAWLGASGGLRSRVSAYIAQYSSKIKTRRALLGARTTGSVYAGEYPTAGGRKTVFTRSAGFWKKGYGTSFLSGPILAKFDALGAETGTMGFPVTNIKPAPGAPSISYATFDTGRIYQRSGAAYAIWGRVYTTYHALGTLTGRLGYPVSSVYATKRGLKARFAHGYLKWVRSTNLVEVHYS